LRQGKRREKLFSANGEAWLEHWKEGEKKIQIGSKIFKKDVDLDPGFH
jgi:hypothetical protein